jgi:hypothetical protein
MRWLSRGTLLATVSIVASGACASSHVAAPAVGNGRGAVPDLRGQRVIVLPVQRISGVQESADSEIEFVFAGRGAGVEWVFPGELAGALERAPNVRASVRGLPVSMFLQAEVNRVGDPLYGQLRRLGALVNGDLALLPVQLRYGSVNEGGELGVSLSVALIEVRTGRVFWYGVVGGQPGPVDDFATVASAVEALAVQVLWFTR